MNRLQYILILIPMMILTILLSIFSRNNTKRRKIAKRTGKV